MNNLRKTIHRNLYNYEIIAFYGYNQHSVKSRNRNVNTYCQQLPMLKYKR